jgi:hypothetical protein
MQMRGSGKGSEWASTHVLQQSQAHGLQRRAEHGNGQQPALRIQPKMFDQHTHIQTTRENHSERGVVTHRLPHADIQQHANSETFISFV